MPKEIAKTNSTGLAPVDLLKDAGKGLEDMRSEDFAIPFFSILQKGSPQCDENDGAYIEAAKPGMIFNTVNNTPVISLTVVPVAYKREFVEWKPREKGGGYIGNYSITDPLVSEGTRNANGALQLKSGNLLIETAYHFIIANIDENLIQGLISMTSTQLKKSRRWNSMMAGLKISQKNGQLVTPATFSHQYKLTTVAEKNEKGSWFGWNIESVGSVSDVNLYQLAKSFFTTVKSGAVQVSAPKQEAPVESKNEDF